MEGPGDLSAERRSRLYTLFGTGRSGIGIPSLQMEKPKIHDMANVAPW